jgi:hypothetical protein
MLNYKPDAHGDFTPAAPAPPKYDSPRTGNTSLSLSAGRNEGAGSVPSFIVPVLVFHIMVKGITLKDPSFIVVPRVLDS